MAIIEPAKRDIAFPYKQKRYAAALRLWHWLNLLIILGSYVSVTILGTVLDRDESVVFIREQIQKKGAVITAEQARAAAQGLRDQVWEVHFFCGYMLAALLLFRLLIELFGATDQKLIGKIKLAYNKYFILKRERKIAKHELVVKCLYVAFYLMILIMFLTGLCMLYEEEVPALKRIPAFRQIHEITMYGILFFILIHIAGVYLAERGQSKGIVSDMINGGRA